MKKSMCLSGSHLEVFLHSHSEPLQLRCIDGSLELILPQIYTHTLVMGDMQSIYLEVTYPSSLLHRLWVDNACVRVRRGHKPRVVRLIWKFMEDKLINNAHILKTAKFKTWREREWREKSCDPSVNSRAQMLSIQLKYSTLNIPLNIVFSHFPLLPLDCSLEVVSPYALCSCFGSGNLTKLTCIIIWFSQAVNQWALHCLLAFYRPVSD